MSSISNQYCSSCHPSKRNCLLPSARRARPKPSPPLLSYTYHLPGSSSVQSAIKGLLEKNFVTATLGEYEVYDKFFALWILQQQGLRTS